MKDSLPRADVKTSSSKLKSAKTSAKPKSAKTSAAKPDTSKTNVAKASLSSAASAPLSASLTNPLSSTADSCCKQKGISKDSLQERIVETSKKEACCTPSTLSIKKEGEKGGICCSTEPAKAPRVPRATKATNAVKAAEEKKEDSSSSVKAVKAIEDKHCPIKSLEDKHSKRAKEQMLTKITVKYDVGYNNCLYLRGEGPSLSWQKGILLTNVQSDEWVFETTDADGEIEFKVLINDRQYEEGPNHFLCGGSQVTYTPIFSQSR